MRKNARRYALKESALYALSSKSRLQQVLQCDLRALRQVPEPLLYTRIWKHKRVDRWLQNPPCGESAHNFRLIEIPHPILKKIQARIADLLSRVETPDFLYSPVKGRSYVDNARAHLDGVAFWQLDIEDYFGTCTEAAVAGFFQRELKTATGITRLLVKLVTVEGRLPQGSPCSPIIAFLSKATMWREILDVARAQSITFSLYADDISLSGQVIRKAAVWEIKKIIHKHGLRTKRSKEVSTIHRPAELTGAIIYNGDVRLPNRRHKAMSELRSAMRSERNPSAREKLERRLAGCYNQKKQVLSRGSA